MSEPNSVNRTDGSPTPDNTPSQSRRSDSANTWAMLAVLIAAISLPYVAAPLARRPVLGATLIAVGAVLAVIVVVASYKWMRLIATIGLAAIIITGGSIIIWGPSAWLGLAQEAAITMINPSPANPSPQPGCISVTFSGTPPAGDVYIVADREAGNPRYYFTGLVIQDPATHYWNSRIQIGNNASDGGKLFTIYVYVLDETLASYLTNAVPLNGITNWSSLVPPPGAILAGGIDVHRDYGNKICSSGP